MKGPLWLDDNERRCLNDTKGITRILVYQNPNDIITNLPNTNELLGKEEEQQESEEQGKQAEKVWVKPKGF